MEPTRAIEKLDLLEQRITRTTVRFGELKERYESLQAQKVALESEIELLRKTNETLTDRIHNIKSIQEDNRKSLDREGLRERIDHVLEKLAELEL